MAWTTSGLFVTHWIKMMDGTAVVGNTKLFDLTLTTHKVELMNDTITPNFSTAQAYTTTGEVSGTGYTATGLILTGLSPTCTESPTGTIKYTHNTLSWATATITAVGGYWYADAITAGGTGGVADPCFVGVWFGQAYTATAGTFSVTAAANGIFTLDLTPGA